MKYQTMKMITAAALVCMTLAFPGAALAAPQAADNNAEATYYDNRPDYSDVQVHTGQFSAIADQIVATGKQYLGVPYKFGAESGRVDQFDCSSFTQYVFKKHGIDLPRSSRQQAKAGAYVPKNELQKGDLVFSDTNRDGIINHVSIYIGNNQLLHTYRVGIGVAIIDFEGSTWDKTFVTARRVIS